MSKNTSVTLPLSGQLTIRTISVAQSAILASLATHDSITLAIEPDSEIDVAGIQLLLAAKLEAKNSSKRLVLATPVAGNVHDVMESAGFMNAMTAEDRQFWLHQ